MTSQKMEINKFSANVSEDLARRWHKYLLEGLDKETKSTLLEELLIPNIAMQCVMGTDIKSQNSNNVVPN